MVQGQGLPAQGTEADVVLQPVQQDLVDLLRHVLPLVIQRVLVHRAPKGLGERKIQVQLSAVQLQLRQGMGRVPRQLRLLDGLSLLLETQEAEKQLPQGLVRLVKGDVRRPDPGNY